MSKMADRRSRRRSPADTGRGQKRLQGTSVELKRGRSEAGSSASAVALKEKENRATSAARVTTVVAGGGGSASTQQRSQQNGRLKRAATEKLAASSHQPQSKRVKQQSQQQQANGQTMAAASEEDAAVMDGTGKAGEPSSKAGASTKQPLGGSGKAVRMTVKLVGSSAGAVGVSKGSARSANGVAPLVASEPVGARAAPRRLTASAVTSAGEKGVDKTPYDDNEKRDLADAVNSDSQETISDGDNFHPSATTQKETPLPSTGPEVDRIIGCIEHEGQLVFLVKWKGNDYSPEVLPAKVVNIKFPQKVIEFYEQRIVWDDPIA